MEIMPLARLSMARPAIQNLFVPLKPLLMPRDGLLDALKKVALHNLIF